MENNSNKKCSFHSGVRDKNKQKQATGYFTFD